MSRKNLRKPKDPEALTNLSNELLTDKQLIAVDCLIGGLSVTETAVEVGVERETVSRWKNGHAGFIAAYNQARIDAHENYRQNLAELRIQALDFLAGMFDGTNKRIDGKTKASIALKLLMMGEPLPYLETDARDVQVKMDKQEAVAGKTGMDRLLAEGW